MAGVQRSSEFDVALQTCTQGVDDEQTRHMLDGLTWVLERKPDAHERAPGI